MNVICLDGRLRISLEEARLSIAAALPVEGGADVYAALLPDGTPDWEGPLEVVHNPHARRGEAYLEADFPALLAELEIVPRMIRRPTWKDFGPGKPLAEYSITRVEFSKLAECYGLSVDFDVANVIPATEPLKACAAPNAEKGAASHWKMKVQEEAAARFARLRASGASPTVHSILGEMVTWCRTNDVKTDGGIYPSSGYLRTHVLGGKYWTPPR